MIDNYSVFKGKRVFVTGDTGFKGSWLCLWLKMLGADVVGFSLPPERDEDHFHVIKLGEIIHHVDGDIRDYSQLHKLAHEFQPEFLFHLAAQALVRRAYDEPKLTFDTNIGGSVNILEIVREINCLRSVIYVTSDKCYKNREWVWGYRENDELGGRDPYSSSKSAAEIVFSSYMDSFLAKRHDLGAASVRAGNVIGGGDWSQDRLVPDCVKSLMNNIPISLRNPEATRPWQHVLEPLSGYLLLAERLHHSPKKYSGSWNFGPKADAIQTVQLLAERIIEVWGTGNICLEPQNEAPHEATLLHLNIDKAMHHLNWQPKWDFDRSVKETAMWYKQNFSGESAGELSRNQIINYMEERT